MSGGLLRRNLGVRHGCSLAGTRVPQNATGVIDYLRRVHQQFLPFGNDGTEADRSVDGDGSETDRV
jgi:hypothetical protein